MLKTWFHRLPGPAPVRVVLSIAIVLVGLVVLGFVFERAGDLLDSGGVIQ